MSGVDAVRGFNFQHCHAVLAALDVAANPDMAGIRVEGTDDLLDIEVHAPGATLGETVVERGLQIKSRIRPYTWARGELLAIVRRWMALPTSAESEFLFLTDGDLGPSGREVVEALEAARTGALEPIAGLLGVAATDPLCAIAGRARIVAESASVEALLLSAEVEVRARLVDGPNHPDAIELAEDRVSALWRLISTRSGLEDAGERFISRTEINDVLGGISQLSAADRWAGQLSEEYIAAAAAEDVDEVIVPTLRAGGSEAKLEVDDLALTVGPLVLAGRTGSGKSTVARLFRARRARSGGRVVVCHAEAYVAQQLDRAVADAVGDVVGRELSRIVGRQVLGDPSAIVVVDGVSEVPAPVRSELAQDLRHHLAGGHGARIVLVGRDEGLCVRSFPASITVGRVYPEAFGPEKRLELTRKILGESEGDSAGDASRLDGSVRNGQSSSFEHECRVALAQVEHALDDAAGNPMLLCLALELFSDGAEFTDRASVYGLSIGRMAERTNAGDVSIASSVLGIVFARLLDEGKRYANPLEWARLFSEAVTMLQEFGVMPDADGVREAVERSGLVNAVVTGIGRTSLRVPLHDSFADYFAAFAHSEGLVAMPEFLMENDENRVLLSSQMRMLDDNEALQVARQLPFSLVRLSEADHRRIDDRTPDLVAAVLSAVIPDGAPTKVAMWRNPDGRSVTQVGATNTGWVERTDAPGIFEGLTVVVEPQDGPILIAVRLWRLVLQQRLRWPVRLRPRSPNTGEEARDQLTTYFNELCVVGESIIRQVAPPVAVDRLARAVGPLGATGVVYRSQAGHLGLRGWPVRYRRTSDTSIVLAQDDTQLPELARWGYSTIGDVASLLSDSPERAVAQRVGDAINELTRNHWI